MIDQESLKLLLTYDPATGDFVWAVDRLPTRAGTVAGCSNRSGYKVIRINNRLYYSHRLAWLYMTGKWPELHIDHIDGDKGNNRFGNLREATRSQNLFNRRKGKCESGLAGAYWIKTANLWRSQIQVNRKMIYLGYFRTAAEAHAAYTVAAKEHFGEFARFD